MMMLRHDFQVDVQLRIWVRERKWEREKIFFFARKVARAVKKIKRDLKHKLILRGKNAHRRAKIDSANSGNSFQFPE